MTYHVKIHIQRHGKFRPPKVLIGMVAEALRYKLERSRV